MDRPNNASFGYRIHADQAHVRAKANYIRRENDHFMDGGRLLRRNEPVLAQLEKGFLERSKFCRFEHNRIRGKDSRSCLFGFGLCRSDLSLLGSYEASAGVVSACAPD